MVNVFAVPIYFICFRECLEATIIVSVLLSFLKQTIGPDKDPKTYKKLVWQVWIGVALGLLLCLCIGGAFIGVFYGLGDDIYSNSEDIWEGTFSLIAAVIITLMGAALLRVSKMQDKWRVKLAKSLEAKDAQHGLHKNRIKRWAEKYVMMILPLITVLREGLEAVIFIGGVSLSYPASAFPLAVVTGLLTGIFVGYLMYRGGNFAPLQLFLIIATCFLYLVAAGLFSKGVWDFENHIWSGILGSDVADVGSGPGSYDIHTVVWHVNCCNPEVGGGGGWGIFNALLGWENTATYGSVLSYNLYWLFVICSFLAMRYNEKTGHWPLMKPKKGLEEAFSESDEEGGRGIVHEIAVDEKKDATDIEIRKVDTTHLQEAHAGPSTP